MMCGGQSRELLFPPSSVDCGCAEHKCVVYSFIGEFLVFCNHQRKTFWISCLLSFGTLVTAKFNVITAVFTRKNAFESPLTTVKIIN